MFILDTDILSEFFYGTEKVVRHVDAAREIVATTIVTEVEILRGRIEYLLKADKPEGMLKAQFYLQDSKRRISDFMTLEITPASLQHFERLRAIKKARSIGRADLLIASIVFAQDATLVTNNTKDFAKVPGLRYQNWLTD